MGTRTPTPTAEPAPATRFGAERPAPPAGWDRSGLPAWSYFSDELMALERDTLFRTHWQLACHVNDVATPGEYATFDLLGERALVVRGRDGQVRAFHNVCRHRGSRVAAETHGKCGAALVCPFHGWAFNLDGTLRGVPAPHSLPALDKVRHGLKPLDMEIWNGFVFVRFQPGPQPSMAELMARVAGEVAPYRAETLLPTRQSLPWGGTAEVNWKSVRDVDNEGYHVPQAHPGLQDLYGDHYYDEPYVNGVSRSFARFNDGPARLWSVRAYKSILPEADWLPESHRRAWLYIGIFPNTVLAFYPDSVMYYQDIPITTTRTRVRSQIYRLPFEDRRWRAARWLATRIDDETSKEDQMLTIWSCEATLSSGYDGIILSDLEYGVRSHHDHLRQHLPVLNLAQAPAAGTLAATNARLLSQRSRAA